MAKQQTRRSISVRGTTHERTRRLLKRLADDAGPESISSLVERLLSDLCDRHSEPLVDRDEVVRYPTRRAAPEPEAIPAHFTF